MNHRKLDILMIAGVIVGLVTLVALVPVDHAWTFAIMESSPFPAVLDFVDRSLAEGDGIGLTDPLVLVFFILCGLYIISEFQPRSRLGTYRSYLGFFFACTLIASVCAVHGTKHSVGRHRPGRVNKGKGIYSHWYQWGSEPTIRSGYASFPSGHTGTAALLIMFAYAAYGPSKRRKTAGLVAGMAALGITAFVGFCRVADGAHWLTDTVAAMLLIWLVCHFLYTRVLRPHEHVPIAWEAACISGIAILFGLAIHGLNLGVRQLSLGSNRGWAFILGSLCSMAAGMFAVHQYRRTCRRLRNDTKAMAAGAATKLTIVIPAYNEEARIAPMLTALDQALTELPLDSDILVVSDGSRDRTKECAEALPLKTTLNVIEYQPNAGKGNAVAVGVLAAKGDLIGFLDADGSSDPKELTRLLQPILDGKADIVVGSRRHPDSKLPQKQPPMREAVGFCFSLLTRILFGLHIKDTQCGCKFFRRSWAREIFTGLSCNHFAFDVEILVMANLSGARLLEMGIRWSDTAGSRVNVLRDGIRMVLFCLLLRWRLWWTLPAISTASPCNLCK